MDHERLVPAYLVGEQSRVVVFACGDPRLNGESVATLVCEELPPETLAKADIKLIGPMRAEYLRDLPPGTRAVIVDGMDGPAPGEIVDIPFIDMSGREEPVLTTSNHKGPLDEIVAVAQLLRDEPVVGRFIGVGIQPVERGLAPTTTAGGLAALRVAIEAAVKALDADEQ
jgi:Ni,Fe-hydrogenase maturation factor